MSIASRSATNSSRVMEQAGQRGTGRVGKPARRSDQFLDGRAMIALDQRNNAGELRAAAWSRRACRTRLDRFCGSSVLGSNFDRIPA